MQATTRAVLGGATTVVGVVGVLVAALTACQQTAGAAVPRSSATGTTTAATTPATIAASSCGVVRLDQGERVPEPAWACLDAALDAGRAASLVVTQPTTEGDPIVLTYRVGGDVQGMEVVTDDRADEFAPPDSRGLHRGLCTGTVRVAEPRDCRPA
ncbi:hypothetical protein ACFP82_10210 [Cellulomonas gelida]|uniref:hypothetical protein n=1 Tax=Cellulomonas gelida TaxID=1712 RepID=UPI0036152C71